MAETMTPVPTRAGHADGDDDIILHMEDVVAGYGSTTVLREPPSRFAQRHQHDHRPNGAGKSTALKAIFGMLKRSSGQHPVRRRGPGRAHPGRAAAGASAVPHGNAASSRG